MKRHFAALSGFLLLAFVLPVQGFETATSAVAITAETEPEARVTKQQLFQDKVTSLYQRLQLQEKGLKAEVFQKALVGYLNLKANGRLSDKQLLTVIDFEKPSSEKRLWIIDLEKAQVLYHTLVAHGKNTGDLYARNFSNTNQSLMSSLGFYVTDNTYFGKHGLSLRLQGLDKNFNTNAMQRAVVMHGADYVSEAFVKAHGRLGRSFGCPALPQELTGEIIDLVKDKTCLFLHYPEKNYSSEFLNEELAMEMLAMN